MEAEYGQFFLANYQCAPPMWSSAVRSAEAKEERGAEDHPSVGREREVNTNGAGVGADRLRLSRTSEPSGTGDASAPAIPSGVAPSKAATASLGADARIAGKAAAAAKRGSAAAVPNIGKLPAPSASISSRGPPCVDNQEADDEHAQLPGSVPPAEKEGGTRPLKEIDAEVQSKLDSFFANQHCWERVAQEVSTMKLRSERTLSSMPPAGRKMTFRVQVPNPYPGVQFRRSKDLNDKHARYAKRGTTIEGEVDEDRQWVRVKGSLFLPLRIGPVQILEPLPDTNGEAEQKTERAVAEPMVVPALDTTGERGPKTVESVAGGRRFCPCGNEGALGSPILESTNASQEVGTQREAALTFFSR